MPLLMLSFLPQQWWLCPMQPEDLYGPAHGQEMQGPRVVFVEFPVKVIASLGQVCMTSQVKAFNRIKGFPTGSRFSQQKKSSRVPRKGRQKPVKRGGSINHGRPATVIEGKEISIFFPLPKILPDPPNNVRSFIGGRHFFF